MTITPTVLVVKTVRFDIPVGTYSERTEQYLY